MAKKARLSEAELVELGELERLAHDPGRRVHPDQMVRLRELRIRAKANPSTKSSN